MPLKISRIVSTGLVVATTNTFSPTGGVMLPISVIFTTRMPNKMGSIPACLTIGKITGMVSSTIDAASTKQPKTRKGINRHMSKTVGFRFKLPTQIERL